MAGAANFASFKNKAHENLKPSGHMSTSMGTSKDQ